MFCLFLSLWLPSLPHSGVAWSRLSSTLLIVYLPNEGGGALRQVIDSPPSPPRINQDFSFLAERCSEGGGFFLNTSGFCFGFFVFFLLVGRLIEEEGGGSVSTDTAAQIPVKLLSKII